MPTVRQALKHVFKWIHSFNPHNNPISSVPLPAPEDKNGNRGPEWLKGPTQGHTSVSGRMGLQHKQSTLGLAHPTSTTTYLSETH